MLKNWIYKKERTLRHNKYTIFGIKISKRRKLNTDINLWDLRSYTMAAALHRSFEKYRGAYSGRDIVIIGGGPSLKYYEDIPNSIKIGLNLAYKMDNINFDYLIAQDNFSIEEDVEGFINYKPDDCVKIIGLYNNPTDYERVLESTIGRCKKREIYILNNRRVHLAPFATDISCEPFVWFCGTVFAALQFALYTSPRRIYLAGFDCTDGIGHFFYDNNRIVRDKSVYDLYHQYQSWKDFKEYFDCMHATKTEIISVNPVNLKGLFKDVYTQSYIDAHPESLKENVEIISEDKINA